MITEIYMLQDPNTGAIRFFLSPEVAYTDTVQRATGKSIDTRTVHQFLADNLVRFIRSDDGSKGVRDNEDL